jgi:signal transduction histidine kinase
MRSLERRLGVTLALLLSLLFAALVAMTLVGVRQLHEAYVLTRLEHDSDTLVAAFAVSADGEVGVRQGRISAIYRQPLSGHYYVLLGPSGDAVRSRSLWDETLHAAPHAPGSVTVTKTRGPAGQVLLARSAGYQRGGQDITLLVAEDLSTGEHQVRLFQAGLMAFALLGLGLVLLVQRGILRAGFRSLDRVRDEVQEVARGTRESLTATVPAEIAPLSSAFNRVIGQLHQRLRRSREALGNLAHALKSPLSLVVQELDAMPLEPGARARLRGQLDRIGQLIERELKRARLAGGGASARLFDPARDVPDLVDAFARLYAEKGIVPETADLPQQELPFDYEDLTELLGNLVDNACKFARERVRVVLSSDERLTVCIDDDGPGVGPHDAARLTTRGLRLDELRPGHGLGLAIAHDIVEGYGGELVFDRSPVLGGLRVTAVIPFPADPVG